MALRLVEMEPDTPYEFICTPTKNELPEMTTHWNHLEELLGQPLVRINSGLSLIGIIASQKTIPNWRMRFCTRMLKLEPFQTYMMEAMPCTSYVGIRADEVEDREGVKDWGDERITPRFPLVEWGWGLGDVMWYLEKREVVIPKRTDCALCFFQTLGEWHTLWLEHPNLYEQGVIIESYLKHTFRSAQRDSHPAALKDLRAEFEGGYIPKVQTMKDRPMMCSVCAR